MGEALELERGAPPPEEGKKKPESRKQPAIDTEMDITPLIDVVFLLVLFYMVVTELTSSEIEELTLPKAVRECRKQKNRPEEKRLSSLKRRVNRA